MNESLKTSAEQPVTTGEQRISPSLPVARSIGFQEFLETAAAATAKIAAEKSTLPGYHVIGYIYIPAGTRQIAVESPQ